MGPGHVLGQLSKFAFRVSGSGHARQGCLMRYLQGCRVQSFRLFCSRVRLNTQENLSLGFLGPSTQVSEVNQSRRSIPVSLTNSKYGPVCIPKPPRSALGSIREKGIPCLVKAGHQRLESMPVDNRVQGPNPNP